jgi:hypothetical protein
MESELTFPADQGTLVVQGLFGSGISAAADPISDLA